MHTYLISLAHVLYFYADKTAKDGQVCFSDINYSDPV